MPVTTTRTTLSVENVAVPIDSDGYPIPPRKANKNIPAFLQKFNERVDKALNAGNSALSNLFNSKKNTKKAPEKVIGTRTTTVTETVLTEDDGTIIKTKVTTTTHPNGSKDVSENRTVIPPTESQNNSNLNLSTYEKDKPGHDGQVVSSQPPSFNPDYVNSEEADIIVAPATFVNEKSALLVNE